MKKIKNLLIGLLAIGLLNSSMCSNEAEVAKENPFIGVMLIGVVLEDDETTIVNNATVSARDANSPKYNQVDLLYNKESNLYEAEKEVPEGEYLVNVNWKDMNEVVVKKAKTDVVDTMRVVFPSSAPETKGIKMDVWVRDINNQVVPGAMVTLDNWHKYPITLPTDKTGMVRFDGYITDGVWDLFTDHFVTVTTADGLKGSSAFSSKGIADNAHITNVVVLQ